MILCAHLYLSPEESGDGELLNLIGAYINKHVPGRRITSVRSRGWVHLQPVARRAIWIADFLVRYFDLDYGNKDHLFKPLPWNNPGEELIITADIIVEMARAADRAGD